MEHLLPGAPLGGLDHNAPEAPGVIVQTMDVLNQVVWRAYQPRAALRHNVDDLVRWNIEFHVLTEGLNEVLSLVSAGADPGLVHGLLLAFGEVSVNDQSPIVPVQYIAVLLGRLLCDLPEVAYVLGISPAPDDADGQDSQPVLAGQHHSRRRLGGRHRDGKVGQGVGAQVQAGPR